MDNENVTMDAALDLIGQAWPEAHKRFVNGLAELLFGSVELGVEQVGIGLGKDMNLALDVAASVARMRPDAEVWVEQAGLEQDYICFVYARRKGSN